MENSTQTPPNEGQFENEGEVTPPIEEPQGQQETPSEEGTPPVETPVLEGEPQAPSYYTPEEMRTLQVDGIDTSRIPPEMVPLYQAMQSPITRKSQELSQKLKTLGQGQTPPQETQQPNVPQQPQGPSIDEMAVDVTLNKLGLQAKPEPWEDGYEGYMMELSDNRRDLKDSVNKRTQAVTELNTFRAGFTPEQFTQIDSQAETKMYQLLSDPATKPEGQRILQAMQTGDTKTLLSFVKDVAKEVLSASPQPTQTRSTPPVTTTPQGNLVNTGAKDPSTMTNEEYRTYRESQA